MLRRLVQRVAVGAKGRSNAVAKSSLFSLAKAVPSTMSYSVNRRAPQRKSTMPSPTKQDKIAKDKQITQRLSEPTISLQDVKNRNELQDKIVDYFNKKITMEELLREIGMRDSLYFPVQMVNGQETGAIIRTREVFPDYVPSERWPMGANFDVQNYITLFLFSGENTLRLFEPNTQLKLVDMPMAHIMQMMLNEAQKSAVSHIIIDPASSSLILAEEQIMYLPYYRQVAFSEINIESLWTYSPHSLNPNRVIGKEAENDENARNYSPKLAPFLVLCKRDYDLTKTTPSETGVFFLEKGKVLPIWTAEDISNQFPEKHPEIDIENYKFMPIDGEDLWTKLGLNTELMSQCIIQFNPDTPKSRYFHGKLAFEIHSTPIPPEWSERMQITKPEDQ